MRIRKIVKISGTHYISIYKQDLIDYDITEGDFVNIENIEKDE